jgi:hypothetical protein
MKLDERLHAIVLAQPYPLIFATISGAHLYGFPRPAGGGVLDQPSAGASFQPGGAE